MFQKAYDFFKYMKSPKWYVDFTNYVYINIVRPFVIAAGQAALDSIRTLVIEASRKDWTNEEKFNWVLLNAKENFSTYSDNMLRLFVEMVVAELKKKGII